jgi:hypothetical protein
MLVSHRLFSNSNAGIYDILAAVIGSRWLDLKGYEAFAP